MSSREPVLSRVRQAAAQGRQYRVHGKAFPEDAAYLGVGGDLCERFAAEVSAVGGQAFVVSSLAEAGAQLARLLAEAGARSALCWKHELLNELKIDEALAAAGIARVDYDSLTRRPADEQRRAILACDVGITSCERAIAETGTLMMCSRPGCERVCSLTPPVHIAIVQRSQLVADLIDAFRLLESQGPARLSSNVTFITGPSKTGDIELQLTTGVHGPGKWQVIVIA